MADRHTPNPDWQDGEEFDSTLSEQPLESHTATPLPLDEQVDTRATGSRGTSRSTRILLGALLLALAAFIWFNYIWQPAQPQVIVGGNGNGVSAGLGQNGLATPVNAPLVAGQPQDDSPGLPLVGGNDPLPAGETPGVAPLPQPGVVARDLEVVELPFLVTQPPAETEEEALAGQADDEVQRPVAVRVSVNPFSPVVLAEPPASAVADAPDAVEPRPSPEPGVINVSIPDGPDQTAITSIEPPTGTTIRPPVPAASTPPVQPVQPPVAAPQVADAPVPAVAAPMASGTAQASSSLAQSLPRPLPGPSLSPVPAVLQERRAVDSVPQPNLAQVASVEEPSAGIDPTVADRVPDTDLAIPEVLAPAGSRVMPADGDPLVAGATPLSRYLRDNDVTFTGMVLGPVSQGVFRSADSPRSVVVGLGQTLPETEITLTDLRGQQAEFTLADASQFLTLDLRR